MLLRLEMSHAQEVVEHVEMMALSELGQGRRHLGDQRGRGVGILHGCLNIRNVFVRYLGQQICPAWDLTETNIKSAWFLSHFLQPDRYFAERTQSTFNSPRFDRNRLTTHVRVSEA